MPFTVHEAAFKKMGQYNVMRPQEQVADPVPENFGGTMSQGLPVKQIPHMEFPRVVYKHPLEPLRQIEHRNDKYEVVGIETVPSEHLTKVVQDEAELNAAMEEGWVKEPYVPKPAPDPNAHLYATRKRKVS